MQDGIHSYRDLIVWQKSMVLVTEVYKLTSLYPNSELYGLSSQSRRCSVSIPSNIAEGRRRGSRKDSKQFLIVAYSSGAELEMQIQIAKNLGYIAAIQSRIVDDVLIEVMKMLNAMISKLKS